MEASGASLIETLNALNELMKRKAFFVALFIADGKVFFLLLSMSLLFSPHLYALIS